MLTETDHQRISFHEGVRPLSRDEIFRNTLKEVMQMVYASAGVAVLL